METTKEKILTVKDIQTVFQCGKNQAYEIIHTNGFPSMQIGRRYYVYERAFTAWLEKNQGKVILK
jgi:hypothetical protein